MKETVIDMLMLARKDGVRAHIAKESKLHIFIAINKSDLEVAK